MNYMASTAESPSADDVGNVVARDLGLKMAAADRRNGYLTSRDHEVYDQ